MLVYYLIKLLLPSICEEGLDWIRKEDHSIRMEYFNPTKYPYVPSQNQSILWQEAQLECSDPMNILIEYMDKNPILLKNLS